MRLSDEERAMLAGEWGEPRRWAIAHQIAVGDFFDAADFVPVSQAHIMADTESLGEAGVAFLETLAAAPEPQRRVRVPTITDPRGLDFRVYKKLGQTDAMAALEARAIAALRAFGVLMTDTCINYQTILPPVWGEHLAMGDTGVVIYSNSVFGARSNFEGGPSALAAGLTGRTPRYGYHLDECRRATRRFRVAETPREFSEWGALGGIVGRDCGSYWEVPVIDGVETAPGSDALKHFGAAMASYGSVALFHMPGITAEPVEFAGPEPVAALIGRAEIDAFLAAYDAPGDKVDVVVFAAPQLSLIEMASVAEALDGRRVHADTTLLVATSPEIKSAADRMGLTARIETSGAIVAAGICFYQSYAGEMAAANGWTRLLTNSAKLVNIIGGYGYKPTLASLGRCVDFGGCRADRLMSITLACHKGIGRAVTGIALVAKDNFSARYDLDRKAGVFSRPSHSLAGQSYRGRILVLDEAKGGVATAWMLHEMAARGIVPLALVFNRVNPILAQGAAFGGVPMVDRFVGDVTDLIRTGDRLRVDPAAGTVEILDRDAE